MERQEWLEQRRTGIGGSDAASVFSIGYGCRRRLCYDKRGIEPDFPRDEVMAMKLGTALEPVFAEEYRRKAKPEQWLAETGSWQHPTIQAARVNPDRLIFQTKKALLAYQATDRLGPNDGVLEIKSQSRGTYSKTKRVGLPQDYIFQLNHAMWITGTEWGAFQVGNRDSGESTSWPVDADKTIIDELEREVPKLWNIISNPTESLPERLDVADGRCSECQWRITCQGDALVHVTGESDLVEAEHLRPLLVEYDERKALFDEAEALLDETKEDLKLACDEMPSARVGWGKKDRKIYFRGQDGRVSWLGVEMAEVYEKMRGMLGGTEAPFPEAVKFRRQGPPFRTLRVY